MAAVVSSPVSIVNATGLHARPAANLVNVAKQYKADIKLVYKGIEANAKSVVSVMGLDVSKGDQIQIKADGLDANEAIKAVTAIIASGCGEN
ncbi:HPr family phosphocarrier protein [Deefgea tanakiae]|jgi:phosphotransferase system HPr (HPr) family protein|uniref:HPr family phosphocarrier protein n=1 Tax=Deefgea tanakiae TaxID=2865840 RepID=A0ABX8Z4N5_9NEIS|nr:HPr family phosphocarrier protein [Deefgea tanakiae]QZA77542.1 HPr family phosphocarrier protein [Deefgea tanakiae]